jgi:AcrR family transcriptional regulator
MGRPREHNDETRERLLQVAGGIIRRGGTEALTVRGLAAEAGVTTRAIYSLFSGLPEVVAELCNRSSAAMLRHHEAVPVTDNPVSELLPLALAFRAGAREQADLYEKLYTPTAVAGSAAATEYPPQIQRTVGRVEDTVRRAILSMIMKCSKDCGRSCTASRPWNCGGCWGHLPNAIGFGIKRSPTTCVDSLPQRDRVRCLSLGSGSRSSEIRRMFRQQTDSHEVARNRLEYGKPLQ